VSFASEGALARSPMTNLSRMGVFLQTRHLLEIGTQFELRILEVEPEVAKQLDELYERLVR
jgi:hypothetical protein